MPPFANLKSIIAMMMKFSGNIECLKLFPWCSLKWDDDVISRENILFPSSFEPK